MRTNLTWLLNACGFHLIKNSFIDTCADLGIDIDCFFCCSNSFKPLSVPISPAPGSEEARGPLRALRMMPIRRTSRWSLSHALRVGTCRRLCKCESHLLIRCFSLNHCIFIPLSFFCDWPPGFLPCSAASTTMSSPCAQTCTPKSTRSGFTSGSGTWRLEWPTASLSSTWWRAAACILRAWNHSSILRGRPWRKVSDGSAPAPTSNTFATTIRWVNWKCQFTESYCPISYFSSSFHGHYNSNNNPRSRISLKKNIISSFRTQKTTAVTQSPCTRSPGLSSSLTTQTPASWPTATPTPIHTCSATWGALPPTQQWRHTVHCGCCATAWLGTPCTWWQWRPAVSAGWRAGPRRLWWWRPESTPERPTAPGWWRGSSTSCSGTRRMLSYSGTLLFSRWANWCLSAHICHISTIIMSVHSDLSHVFLSHGSVVLQVVPMLNPDGVIVGNYRCSLAGRDLNRYYKTLLRDSFPCVWHTRNMVER